MDKTINALKDSDSAINVHFTRGKYEYIKEGIDRIIQFAKEKGEAGKILHQISDNISSLMYFIFKCKLNTIGIRYQILNAHYNHLMRMDIVLKMLLLILVNLNLQTLCLGSTLKLMYIKLLQIPDSQPFYIFLCKCFQCNSFCRQDLNQTLTDVQYGVTVMGYLHRGVVDININGNNLLSVAVKISGTPDNDSEFEVVEVVCDFQNSLTIDWKSSWIMYSCSVTVLNLNLVPKLYFIHCIPKSKQTFKKE